MLPAGVSDLRKLLEDKQSSVDKKTSLVLFTLQDILNSVSLGPDPAGLVALKRGLYQARVLDLCVEVLKMDHGQAEGGWNRATQLAHVLSSCCVGVEPDRDPGAFHRLLLPSVMDSLLSLAIQLMKRSGGGSEFYRLFRKVLDSVGWLLRYYKHLTTHVLLSLQYERLQMCDDVTISLECVSLWIHVCTASRDFLSGLSEDSVMLLLNDAVGQLAVSSDAAVGRAAVQLVLLIASQLEAHLKHLLHRFRGLDHLLNKDWRGRGFNQEVDQLITLLHSDRHTRSHLCSERVQAVCVIQAAWRAHRTRKRIKTLHRAVRGLQNRYRARMRQREQQEETLRWEEELSYQVCVRRQRARREFHQKQRHLLHLLPPDQVQSFLSALECSAAVTIQRFWRGHRDRKRYNTLQHTHTPLHTHTQHQAASTLQRAVLCFLKKRRSLKSPPTSSFWIGQEGLTDSRRAELKTQVEEYISLHPSSVVSEETCKELHDQTKRLLLQLLQSREEKRRGESHSQAVLAQINSQLELLSNAPPLSVVKATDVQLFQSHSGPLAAMARQSHNALLQAGQLPWWRALGESDSDDIISCLGPGDPTHLEELEAEFGGLFVEGGAC
ncbi:IQ calmodulin-binding motif-containing protein 1 isoform 2-T2 [Polymixia lowei]